MVLNLESPNHNWRQCENYNILTKLKICTSLILVSVSVYLFITFKKQKHLEGIRSMIQRTCLVVPNFIQSLRRAHELEKRNEVLKLNTLIIEQYIPEGEVRKILDPSDSETEQSLVSLRSEPSTLEGIKEPNIILSEATSSTENFEKEPDHTEIGRSSTSNESKKLTPEEMKEPNIIVSETSSSEKVQERESTSKIEKLPPDLVGLIVQSRPSTDSNILPPVKKQKFENKNSTNIPKETELLTEPTSKEVLKKTKAPRTTLRSTHNIRQTNSHQIRAPPSSPSSNPSSPGIQTGSAVNIITVKSGIFEGRKRFPREKSVKVAIVDAKGNINHVHKIEAKH